MQDYKFVSSNYFQMAVYSKRRDAKDAEIRKGKLVKFLHILIPEVLGPISDVLLLLPQLSFVKFHFHA